MARKIGGKAILRIESVVVSRIIVYNGMSVAIKLELIYEHRQLNASIVGHTDFQKKLFQFFPSLVTYR